MASAWCILRTSGRSTIPLTESLSRDGYEAWTPIETRTVRIPRANARREVRQAIMPTYVFASAEHLVDLIQLADMPVKPRRGAGLLEPAHADFSVLHCFGKIPLVAESDLAQLRKIEAKRTPVKKADKPLPKGVKVRVLSGSMEGLVGSVQRSDRGKTLVFFNRVFDRVEIPTTLLEVPGDARMAA